MQRWIRFVVLPMALAAGVVGCKQGEGQVCQIDSDCEEGLECNAGTRRCQRPGSGGTVDAALAPDANTAAIVEYDLGAVDQSDEAELGRANE